MLVREREFHVDLPWFINGVPFTSFGELLERVALVAVILFPFLHLYGVKIGKVNALTFFGVYQLITKFWQPS